MKLPHSVCEVLRDHVVLESECIDRMYLGQDIIVPLALDLFASAASPS